MGVTATGLRYPEPTEPVSQGAQNLKNLADDVTAKYARIITPGPKTFYPVGSTVAAGAVVNMTAGQVDVTTDAGGQVVVYPPGAAGWTTIVAVLVGQAHAPSAPVDYTFSAAARSPYPNSFYVYVLRAGVKGAYGLAINYVAFGY